MLSDTVVLGLVVALSELSRKGAVDGQAIGRASLGNLMMRLEKDDDLAGLVRGFDRVLRNAMAHRTYQVLPTLERIRFADRRESRVVSPAELVRRVRETGALVVALVALPLMVVAEELRLFVLLRKCRSLPEARSPGSTLSRAGRDAGEWDACD
jgi:hypothetical protein